jgi:hypothetical protein
VTAPDADPAKTAVALLVTTRPSDRALAGWLPQEALWFSGPAARSPEVTAAWLEKGWG